MRTLQTRLFDRRVFLATGASWLTFPTVANSQLPSNPDVIVVGAGSAGLAAARTLIEDGKSVVVVEAADRIGGRAWTESTTFGVPFDHGCSWITSGRDNPYKSMADRWQFELHNHSNAGEELFVGDRRATSDEWAQYSHAWSAVNGALNRAGENGIDVAASTVTPRNLPFSSACETWVGPMDMGVDFKDLSTKDYAEGAETTPSYMVRQGFGAIVARLGAGLPVQLNTPATRISWGGNGVSVETPAGTIRGKACILTVSTGVLGSGAITFDPVLPDWKQQAIHDVPMGLLAKAALQFDGNRLGLNPNEWLTYRVSEDLPTEACFFLTWPFEFDMMIGFLGGEFGWNLSAAGTDAAVDFALGEVVQMVGSDAAKHFVKGDFTRWASNPLTMGAYAAPRPGKFAARGELARQLGDRLFFAGEAVAGPYVATCGGAYLSGEKTARQVSAML